MTTAAQKHTERFYLDKFLETIQLRPKSIEKGPEPPDFLLFFDEKCIAVEVTEYHSNEVLRAAEEVWDRIRRLFHKRRKGALLKLFGRVVFKNKLDFPRKNECRKFADQLVAFASSVCPKLTEKSKGFRMFGASFPLLDKYLDSISLKLLEEPHNEFLDSNYACGSIGLEERKLVEIFKRKQLISKLDDAAEHWLLVVLAWRMSQSSVPVKVDVLNGFNEANKALPSSLYDEVYIFSYMWDNIVLWEKSTKRWKEITPWRSARPRK